MPARLARAGLHPRVKRPTSHCPLVRSTMTTTVPVSARSTRKPIRKTAFGNECLTLLDRLELTRKRSTGRAFALGMTSCLPGEGVTTIAAETAAGAAGPVGLRALLGDGRFAPPGGAR